MMQKNILIPLEKFSQILCLFYKNDSVFQNSFLLNMALREYGIIE